MIPGIWDIILLHSQPSAGVSAANITSQPDMSVSKTERKKVDGYLSTQRDNSQIN